MKIELHLLQNFPPSCLNRDDTNSPKDCEFGGVRRARISSQSLKRAIRQDFERHHRVSSEAVAVRTKLIVERVADIVLETASRDRAEVVAVIEQVLAAAGLEVTKKDGTDTKTQYLLFLPRRSLRALGALVHEYWDLLVKALDSQKTGTDLDARKASAKATKKAKSTGASAALGADLTKRVVELIYEASDSPELALFGRMIADKPERNVDAACQVAHAISTHRVAMEFDFYTAVDDLKPRDNAGADMMGTVQFNSACFYRYAVVDLDQLARTLSGTGPKDGLDPAAKNAAVAATKAWLLASVTAIPSARQNGFAAFTPPEVVLTATRSSGHPLSLANAFAEPVRRGHEQGEDIVTRSAQALGKHLGDLTSMYGPDGTKFRLVTARNELAFSAADSERLPSLVHLVAEVEKDLAIWAAST